MSGRSINKYLLDQAQKSELGDDTHPRHFLSVSELFQPLASGQFHVERIFRPHGGLRMLTRCKIGLSMQGEPYLGCKDHGKASWLPR